MPNLVGIIDRRALRGPLEQDLSRMIAAVDIPAFHYETRVCIDQGVAVGNVLPGVDDNLSQPQRDHEGRWLMLDGEILNVDEVVLDLKNCGIDPTGMDDAGLAFALFKVRGLAFAERLSGSWNVVLHDPIAQQTVLISDRAGSRVLYYAQDGERFVFASEAKAVLAGRGRPTAASELGLFALLSGGGQYGASTWLDGVRVIDPGALLSFGKDVMTRRRYFKLRFRESGPEMSEDDYAGTLASTLRQATGRALKGRGRRSIGITLSGGLDSRAIALSIDRRHLPLPAITYGDPDSADVEYARELAAIIGLKHLYIEQERDHLLDASRGVLDRLLGPTPSGTPRGFFGAQVDRVVWRAEGMATFTGLTSMIWHPRYAQLMSVVLNGACGDALTGSHLGPELLLQPKRQKLIEMLRRQAYWQRPDLVREVVRPGVYARCAAALPDLFAEQFAEIDSDEAMALSSVWDMENRQRRGAFAGFTIERYFCTLRAPFLDNSLVNGLAAIPPHWRFQQRIYKRMIVRAFPKARHVPWAYTRGKITASPSFELARETFNFLRSRARSHLPFVRPAPNRWAIRDTDQLLRADPEITGAVLAWTKSDVFPVELLDALGVRRVVERFVGGEGGGLGVMIAHLVSLARWHRWGLSGAPIRIPPEADPSEFGVALAR